MNTNTLKRFAQEARTKLREQVAAKLEEVLHTDSAKLRGKKETLDKLRAELAKVGKDSLIDRVAYTWFNRFVALRFMDANEYQVLNTLVLTPLEGAVSPEILAKAQTGSVADELMSLEEKKQLLQLFTNSSNTNPENEVYSILLVAVCNHLYKIFPFLFEAIDDYTELLLPDDLTSNHSIIKDIVEGMTDEDCQHVELIGWLYQFYISERKDEVFAAKGKVGKEDIPAATQLFTPRWIVEYMVQNSLGKLWLQNRPNSSLKEHMPYYIESPSTENEDYLKIETVEEIKLLDPACGSGHILVYGFDLLAKIYEEEGYPTNEIPKLIIENNLYGYEIDSRAAQLAAFAVMMRARKYYRRYFNREISVPKILCYKDLSLRDSELQESIAELKLKLSDDLLFDLETMQQATNYGSLIIPKSSANEIQNTISQIKAHTDINVFLRDKIDELLSALHQLLILTNKYHAVVANPPYMGGAKMNKELSDFVKANYPLGKADLFASFIERSIDLALDKGSIGLVTMESWMFLSSYENLREELITNYKIRSLSHFGWHIMRIAFGTCSFILEKTKPNENFKGVYNHMEYDNINKETERPLQFPIENNGRYNIANQKDFSKIPGSPIGYWLSENVLNSYDNPLLNTYLTFKRGIGTGDNNRFLRYWHEIHLTNSNLYDTNFNEHKWQKYNKGGAFRKWYGNREYVINWQNNGDEVRNNYSAEGKQASRPQNLQYNFLPNISYSSLTSGDISFRVYLGFLNDQAGNFFVGSEENLYLLLPFLNSNTATYFLKIKNNTLNITADDLNNIPIASLVESELSTICQNNISISKEEWNTRETSWDFKQNELIRLNDRNLENSYHQYTKYWTEQFVTLHAHEEELNRQFIDIYGLQDELTPEVSFEDITLLKDEVKIVGGKLEFQPKEIMQQLVSYAVGCMFGRYSLDKEGLILANTGDTLEDYIQQLAECGKEPSLIPDEDNIITILDNEWFADDIVAYFNEFMTVCFGEENLRENMNFLLDALGRKSIREYFVRDFYADHIQRYQKRPIYWMFSSPQRSFRVLVYLHRYTPDTLNEILNNYLREFIEKLNNQLKLQENISSTSTGREQALAEQQVEQLRRMIEDCEDYEKILYSLATERIHLDLDDGVYVNINKLGQAVEEVKGLNDKVAKAKVKAFDWIDSNQIR